MTAFDDCLAFVLAEEGGNVDDPQDPGGRTRKGITQKTYDLWRDKQGEGRQDVWMMTDDECRTIYDEEYWTQCHCDALEKPVALCVFDTAVNSGCNMAIRLLQESVGLDDDGIFGPKTLDAVSNADVSDLIQAYHGLRETYYRSLSGFIRFGHGWLNRNDSCERLALSWIGASNDKPSLTS